VAASTIRAMCLASLDVGISEMARLASLYIFFFFFPGKLENDDGRGQLVRNPMLNPRLARTICVDACAFARQDGQ
jgi:hypothetical protein